MKTTMEASQHVLERPGCDIRYWLDGPNDALMLLGARLVASLPDDGDSCRVVEHRRRGGGDRVQAQGGDDTHGLAPNRHWCLSKYWSHAAERILAACSMLP